MYIFGGFDFFYFYVYASSEWKKKKFSTDFWDVYK